LSRDPEGGSWVWRMGGRSPPGRPRAGSRWRCRRRFRRVSIFRRLSRLSCAFIHRLLSRDPEGGSWVWCLGRSACGRPLPIDLQENRRRRRYFAIDFSALFKCWTVCIVLGHGTSQIGHPDGERLRIAQGAEFYFALRFATGTSDKYSRCTKFQQLTGAGACWVGEILESGNNLALELLDTCGSIYADRNTTSMPRPRSWAKPYRCCRSAAPGRAWRVSSAAGIFPWPGLSADFAIEIWTFCFDRASKWSEGRKTRWAAGKFETRILLRPQRE